MKENYYEILNISPTATMEELKESYLKAKTAHSEENLALYSIMASEDLNENINKIEEAYKVLANETTRAKYNEEFNYPPFNETSKRPPKTNPTPTVRTNSSAPSVQANGAEQPKISNLVANNKFALRYEIDPIFEKEIKESESYSGELLRKIREYKKVDIPRMCEMTRISKTHLRNIEEENLSDLPARVYTRGFVYQYAKCLKMNPEEVASSYMARVDKELNKN